MKRLPSILLKFSICAVLTAAAACSKREKTGIQVRLGEEAIAGEAPVEALRLKAGDYEDVFKAPGVIEAWDEVTVSGETSARVVKVTRELGDDVKAGETLVELDDSTLRARIKKLEAEIDRVATYVEKARRDLKREQSLYEGNASAGRAVDDAVTIEAMHLTELASAQAELEMARVDLAKHTIRSPIGGTVSTRHVAVGEYVTPGVKLYDIVLTENVKFVCSLSERDIPRIKLGQELALEIDAFPGEPLMGRLSAIAPAGNKGTRTFRMELTVANKGEPRLRPQMSGRAKVTRGVFKDSFLVPEEAVLRRGDGNFVYLAKSGGEPPAGEGAEGPMRAVEVGVEILAALGPRAVVRGGLETGDLCIILGQHAVRPDGGVRVRNIHDEPPEVQFD